MRRRLCALLFRHQRKLELTESFDLGERVEAAGELTAQIDERHRVLLRLVCERHDLALVLRLFEIDVVVVELVTLEKRDRATGPRAALLAEDLRFEIAVAESVARRLLLRLARRRGCRYRLALRLGIGSCLHRLVARHVIAAE